MTYIDDTALELKCDVDALYHGDIPIEAVGTEDVEVSGYSEGSLASAKDGDQPIVIEGSPMTPTGLFYQAQASRRTIAEQWAMVDRICGD